MEVFMYPRLSGFRGQIDWERYAECYDALSNLRPYNRMLREVAQIVLSQAKPHHILDASCGTGNFIQTIAESAKFFEVQHITGIDRSQAMINCARRKLCQFSEVLLQEADLDEPLFYPDDAFTQVVSIETLHAVRDPLATLREFFRVLVPGGILTLVNRKPTYEDGLILKSHCESHKPDEYWLNAHVSPEREEALIQEAISDERLLEQMLYVARTNRLISRSSFSNFYNTEDLAELLTTAGFFVSTVTHTYELQNVLIVATKKERSAQQLPRVAEG